ncbi:protealysin inhibitor emfourin [Microbacterium elymi]|uniref:Uncharacterized protein n=1 Tax=Microbacterium elymi TaxID=2909587 RepID=A0ABY5NKL5_9MICO|nr:protealysin inhibitor emfourin [Microbacterium elymi]UUT35679.1 hypothetical protein L2X98_20715 [Microbacterium elymi]
MSVTVIRTGGIAGLRRSWTARPSGDDASRWAALIRQCPWDDATAQEPPEGADRFAWEIRAQLDEAQRAARLSESRMQGPWRDLVHEVQAFERERRTGR